MNGIDASQCKFMVHEKNKSSFFAGIIETEILVKTTRKPISQKFWNLKQETVYWHKRYSQQLSMMNMAGAKQKYRTTWLVDEEKVSHDTG